MTPVKVFNKGKRPIVWRRSRHGAEVIHPNKSDIFSPEKAKEIIEKYDDACSEEDFQKILEARKAEADKKAEKEVEAQKKRNLSLKNLLKKGKE